jgi:hypothetical protein
METGQGRQKEVTHHFFSVLRFLSVLFLDFSLPLRRFPGLLFLSWFKWDMAVFQCCAADMVVFQCCAADMVVFQYCAAAKVVILGSVGKKYDFIPIPILSFCLPLSDSVFFTEVKASRKEHERKN